jgi:ABC-2 type transport system permease protein
VLGLGAVMAAEVGLLCGIYLKDITSLFAIWKLGGILLFAPALVYMFPQIPEWVVRVFPTYYLVQPIVELALQGAGWREIAGDVVVLIAVDAVLAVALLVLLRRTTRLAG